MLHMAIDKPVVTTLRTLADPHLQPGEGLLQQGLAMGTLRHLQAGKTVGPWRKGLQEVFHETLFPA